MKFNVESETLLRICEVIEKAVPKTTTERILTNIHFRLRWGKCTVTATDNRIMLRTSFPADADEEFEFIVNGDSFVKSLKKIKVNETIEVVFDANDDDGRVSIISKKFTRTFKHLADARNFPYQDFDMRAEQHILGRREVDKIIFATKEFATVRGKGYDKIYYGKYESQQYEKDVKDEDKTYFTSWAGTDTVRLFYRFDERPFPLKEEMMIPANTLLTLGKILASKACKKSLGVIMQQGHDSNDNSNANYDDIEVSYAGFKIPSEHCIFELFTRLCENGFPDFKRIIPKGCNVTSDINSKNLIESLDICKDISSGTSKDKVVFSMKDDNFLVTAENNDDKIESSFECVVKDDRSNESIEASERFELAFNSKFVKGMMGIFKDSPCDKNGNNCTMEYTSSIHPAIFKNDADEENVNWLLMPIHV